MTIFLMFTCIAYTQTKNYDNAWKALNENKRSLNMVKKIGFTEISSLQNKTGLTHILSLKKEEFPNTFSQKILSRLEYAKI